MKILCLMLLIFFCIFTWMAFYKTARLMSRLDEMLDSAVSGTFQESGYREDMLSRLEAKMYRYLSVNRQNQREMVKERDAVKTLVSDISHQTKTPVANMLLYAQLLQENESLDREAVKIAGLIEAQAEKLHFLLQSLIRISRLENGILTVLPRENRVQELLDGLVCPAEAGVKGVKYQIKGNAKELSAFFDRKWTLEALQNLVDNGVKYTPGGGNVTVSVQEYEMFIRIDVRDTGIGISEEETARIFGRFYRSPRVQDEKGVGLGLYLTRAILSRQGGYVKVSSVLEEGSVFSMFLPKEPMADMGQG